MSKGKFGNSKKVIHLAAIPEASLEAKEDTLSARCKFNFSYFCKQDGAGKAFGDLTKDELEDLFNKIKSFCHEPLSYWKTQKHGQSTTLAIYRNFPINSDFTHPKHVPHDVHWGRFRITGEVRLAGFVVPPTLCGTLHIGTSIAFDSNTFYVVFLDSNHGFYKTKK